MKTVTLSHLNAFKRASEPFSCLTAYDASFAQHAGAAGIDVLLVGDSLGMVLQGHASTIPVTLDDILYHTRCVARGKQRSLLMVDLPFMSNADTRQVLHDAGALMRAGAELVKIEGAGWMRDDVRALTQRGVPVCAHLGLTPQSVHQFGGYKVQGREQDDAQRIVDDARLLVDAGASVILLECVPAALGRAVRDAVEVPVIGIGAGPDVDGQILVMHDILGVTHGRPPRFAKNFLTGRDSIQAAFAAYHDAVKTRQFPAEEHCF
ncbi:MULTISPECIES: 3-methyl-2-oxobutanoate hydroxymethyltransferase [Chromohalobacter]|uniref:3-methyl-2-oxobutanoate hydroxymethyltransferase n=2 Tax=Chromohalobacter TaxID=42054 RepID=A0A1Q8TCS6_9GAMM|nr:MULTISPECIES: 3-methyl-2-oxobutanoate hydroxymethyltransferase [Chromohalobacter]MCK0752370.1 3-methyl-2-oxobutanoate hydroxymethyltransferase [Chromohalobacter japonicus]MCK0766239.1 3-methyl-2-oxobutanoate hydroxymethyltransferase [Chromohalobacter beijerinckii]OLO11483.1 3-methyl-2-oxobutanoate hydroxymethyltransferase [Chromohalobacter japonicus]